MVLEGTINIWWGEGWADPNKLNIGQRVCLCGKMRDTLLVLKRMWGNLFFLKCDIQKFHKQPAIKGTWGFFFSFNHSFTFMYSLFCPSNIYMSSLLLFQFRFQRWCHPSIHLLAHFFQNDNFLMTLTDRCQHRGKPCAIHRQQVSPSGCLQFLWLSFFLFAVIFFKAYSKEICTTFEICSDKHFSTLLQRGN